MEKTVRLWPHHLQGEGHYVALLKKTQGSEHDVLRRPIIDMVKGELSLIKTHLYVRPEGLPSLQGLKIVKSGWYLGEQKKTVLNQVKHLHWVYEQRTSEKR
jgi:hypothetical protein